LGYTDPEEERMKAEAERRRTQGVAGEWQVVEQPTLPKTNDEADTTSESPKKREAQEPPDSEDTRSFKLRKKVAPSVSDDWDAALIPIKLKPKKAEEALESAEEVKKEEESSGPAGTAPIKWTSRGWKRPEDEPDGIPDPPVPKDEEVETKLVPEPESESIATISEPEVKRQPEAPPVEAEPPTETVGETGAVFRKRKFGGNRGRR
jgi:WW domain-binding protein 4